jgi:N-acetylated-alpha-linked acidic dipeptidase
MPKWKFSETRSESALGEDQLTIRILRAFLAFSILLPMLVASAAAPDQGTTIQGFSTTHSNTQRDWEAKFRSIVSADNIRDYDKRLSARPHHVGSPYDKDNAEWILSKFKEWGYDAHIETFDVLFPTPKERILEMIAPIKFKAKLQEPALSIDPTSGQTAEQLPTYNAYSIDGDVTAPLVYVNDGSRDDYETLDRMGISVKGAIVIARYGEAWRGVKPKVAAEHGAIGCIIYSDPKEDGFFYGLGYPEGGTRPKDGVQRGSVMDTDYPGDPLTPGAGSTKDAKRLAIREAKTITKIPVMPISYEDAQPMLEALTGEVAPESWRGGLPITYRIGPGPAKVHLKVTSNWDIKPVYDVIAKLPGATSPDEWIIRGNHHDAWVNGANDPDSGMSAVLEEARALGELVRQGWKPGRTIIFTAWDGEEPGLLGSTEWVETHLAELQDHTVAYINSDSNGRGFFRARGSHSLEHFINDVARDITDPEKNIPVWKRAQLYRIANAKSAEDRQELRQRKDLRIGALGDGSDYTAFIHHAGIASLNLGYGGEDDGTAYHSIYDDFYWYTHFSDTNFAYGKALAQTAGTAVLRLADADLLPYQFTNSSDTIRQYVKDLQKSLKASQDEIRERNRQIEEGVFSATADPKKTSVPPPVERVPIFMNFAPLENALEVLDKSVSRYQRAMEQVQARGGDALPLTSLQEVNQSLLRVEHGFTSQDGLPDRPWFRHQIYAPGAYTGYGAKPIAAVREAMDKKDWEQADAQIPRIGKILESAAAAIDVASAQLEKSLTPVSK